CSPTCSSSPATTSGSVNQTLKGQRDLEHHGGMGAKGSREVSLSVVPRVVGWSCEQVPGAATGRRGCRPRHLSRKSLTFPMGLL
ncbi:MAG: hypothetical protein ACRDSH_10630, partial [Pseudonocardiaceae bacterium]